MIHELVVVLVSFVLCIVGGGDVLYCVLCLAKCDHPQAWPYLASMAMIAWTSFMSSSNLSFLIRANLTDSHPA